MLTGKARCAGDGGAEGWAGWVVGGGGGRGGDSNPEAQMRKVASLVPLSGEGSEETMLTLTPARHESDLSVEVRLQIDLQNIRSSRFRVSLARPITALV